MSDLGARGRLMTQLRHPPQRIEGRGHATAVDEVDAAHLTAWIMGVVVDAPCNARRGIARISEARHLIVMIVGRGEQAEPTLEH